MRRRSTRQFRTEHELEFKSSRVLPLSVTSKELIPQLRNFFWYTFPTKISNYLMHFFFHLRKIGVGIVVQLVNLQFAMSVIHIQVFSSGSKCPASHSASSCCGWVTADDGLSTCVPATNFRDPNAVPGSWLWSLPVWFL